MAKKDLTAEAREAWAQWPMLPAVRAGRVHVSQSDALLRPGPRLLEALDVADVSVERVGPDLVIQGRVGEF